MSLIQKLAFRPIVAAKVLFLYLNEKNTPTPFYY